MDFYGFLSICIDSEQTQLLPRHTHTHTHTRTIAPRTHKKLLWFLLTLLILIDSYKLVLISMDCYWLLSIFIIFFWFVSIFIAFCWLWADTIAPQEHANGHRARRIAPRVHRIPLQPHSAAPWAHRIAPRAHTIAPWTSHRIAPQGYVWPLYWSLVRDGVAGHEFCVLSSVL